MALAFEAHRGSVTDVAGTVAPAVAPAVRLTVGEVVIVYSVLNHSSNSPTIADTTPTGITWVALAAVDNGDVHLRVWGGVVRTEGFETTETATVTWAGSSGGRGFAAMFNFTSALGSGGPFFESFTVATATGSSTTPSVTKNPMPSDSKALIGIVGIGGPNGDTFTQDADYANNTSAGTTGGTAALEASARFGTRITTATSDTWAPTLGTSRVWAAALIGIQETSPVTNVSVTSVAATATAAATTPVPRIAPASAAATATALATTPVPRIAPNAVAPTAAAAASTPVPAIAVTSLAAAATALAAIPVIDTGGGTTDATVTGVAATATAAASTPVPTVAPTSLAATATAAAGTPSPTIAPNSVAAIATASATSPGLSLSLGSTAATASALATTPVPTISVVSLSATATALATSPGLSVSQPTPAATATAAASTPTPVIALLSATATATAEAIAPTMLVVPGPAELVIALEHYTATLHLPNVHDLGVEIGKTYELSIAEISPQHAVEIGFGNTYALEITMSNETVYVGTQVEATGTFTAVDGGTAVDPTTVTFAARAPSGATTSYVYGVAAEVVKDATGIYTFSVTPTSEGVWKVAGKGTGAAVVVNEETFTALPSIFD